ncbi:MAG: lysyl-tRNA synthetase, class [Thermoleophilaceae bacterium]|jgi:lysyl-tRNA synthetase class 2|nr:lysyl-tRNA synthetase, class [Thermoleophilaceae bacterium]MEA2470207.1 lysyl-tRNA synthetase, class [Thermoleophilaceae bacterium]
MRLANNRQTMTATARRAGSRQRDRAAPRVAAALATATVGALSVLSAVTPNVPGRQHLLLAVEPGPVMALGHVLATFAGLGLVYLGWGIHRGRRRAANAAIAVLVILALLHTAKGLDYEESAVALALAALLYAARRSCRSGGAPGPVVMAALVALGAVALGYASQVAVLLASNRAGTLGRAVTATAKALGHGAWWLSSGEPTAIGLDVLLVIAVGASAVFIHALVRPAQSATGHSAAAHRRAAEIVTRHGRDSLDPFALREEKTFFFARGGLLAYRTLRGTAVVSGDPIGPPGAGPGIVADFMDFASGRGWRVVITAASDRLLDHYRSLGLRTMCIGEEAVVDPAAFSLEGRAIRKVRQSVARAERQGWTLAIVAGLEPGSTLSHELAAVEERWRASQDRLCGFAMSLGRLWGAPEDATAVYALGRAPDGQLRTFIRFARCADTLSLDVMRRSGDEPNGLNEALIARALAWARERELREVSLNFAGFSHVIGPQANPGRAHRLLRYGLELAHGRFQLERLMAFNAKFGPTWRPRFLVYETPALLPLAALRVLQAESYIRPPRSRQRPRRWTPQTVQLPHPESNP